jgi:hypothetical protein
MAYQPRIVAGSNTYHDEVRARLGVSAGVLPDTDIDAPSVLPVAEGLVVSRVPDYSSLTGDDMNFLYAATVCMIAAVLAPSMASRLKASEGDSDYKYANQNVNWVARGETLTAEAYSLLDLISTQTTIELTQMVATGPTTLRQQQMKAQGSDFITPDSGDITLYPTNME